MIARAHIVLKAALGVCCLTVGVALVGLNVATVARAWEAVRHGFPLLNIGGLALGLVALGASADLLRRARPAEPKKENMANSIWADRAAIERAGIDEKSQRARLTRDPATEGIYLGAFTDEQGTIELNYNGGKSILSIGVPGANKSTGLVIPALSELHRSKIVVDFKGELHAVTAEKCGTIGRVLTLAPFHDETKDGELLGRFHWNPMLQIPDAHDHEFESMAFCIADAITDKGDGGGNSKFFENSALNLAHVGIMWERFTKGKSASLRNVRAMIAEPNRYDTDKTLIGGFLFTLNQMAECEIFAIQNAAGRLYSRLTDKNSQATGPQDVIDTFMTSTRFLDDPRIGADMWQGEAIRFAEFHDNITTVFLCLPPHQLTAQSKWLKLFCNISLAEFYRNPPKKPKLPPILYILDEFGNWGGGMSEILTAMNLSRGYRVMLWLFIQSVSQLRSKYPDSWSAFFSGSGAVTTFRTGDMESSELLAKFYGNKEQFVTTQTVTGMSDTPQAIPLIRPEDINRLRQGQMISLIEPCQMPIKCDAPVYVHTRFNDGLNPNPFYHG
jgi:type IV secretory pathway TraG/TraD family ATPase VirD4